MDTVVIKRTGLGILIGVLLMVGVQFASAWTPPSGPFPNGQNEAAPVNTSSNAQIKPGFLGVQTLLASGPGNLGHVEAEQGFFGAITSIPSGNSNLFQVGIPGLAKSLIFNSGGDFIINDGSNHPAGSVLTNDGSGRATWGTGISSGVEGHTLRYNGSSWVDSGLIRSDGSLLVNISASNDPLPQSQGSFPSVPTLLVTGGDIIALDAPPTQQSSYQFVKEPGQPMTANVQVSNNINGAPDTLELLDFWQNISGTHQGVNGFQNFQAARISGPCNDTSFGGNPGTNYDQSPECNAQSYPIQGSDTRPYVYELYSKATYNPGNGNNGYTQYTLKAIKYKRVQTNTPIPGGGGNVIAIHGKITDLAGPNNPVCADATGNLISCGPSSTSTPPPSDFIRMVEKTAQTSDDASSVTALCPSPYVAIAVSCDSNEDGGPDTCQLSNTFSGFGASYSGTHPLTAAANSGRYTGGFVSQSSENANVMVQVVVTCMKYQ